MSDLDPFHYARDHDAGPGMWCVRGPNFEMPVPDKMLALAIGKLLSGKTQEAADMVRDWHLYRPEAPAERVVTLRPATLYVHPDDWEAARKFCEPLTEVKLLP